MALIILKLIMFAVLIVGPILIGRELSQAARGKLRVQPSPAAAPADEEAA